MIEFLETTVDKFTFKVALDRYYTPEGVWVKPEGDQVRLGLTDFIQQRSGDVAFVTVAPDGSQLLAGDEFATVETIKVTISLGSPVSGELVAANPDIVDSPELINQDPYGAGWLAFLKTGDFNTERKRLLDAQAYFDLMKRQAEAAASS